MSHLPIYRRSKALLRVASQNPGPQTKHVSPGTGIPAQRLETNIIHAAKPPLQSRSYIPRAYGKEEAEQGAHRLSLAYTKYDQKKLNNSPSKYTKPDKPEPVEQTSTR